MLLTLAQARLSPCSGFAQTGLLSLALITNFQQAAPQSAESLQLEPRGPKTGPNIKIAKMCPTFEANSLIY